MVPFIIIFIIIYFATPSSSKIFYKTTSTDHQKSITYSESEFINRLQEWRHELFPDHHHTDALLDDLENTGESDSNVPTLHVHWVPNDCNAMNIKFKKIKTIHEGKRNTVFKVVNKETDILYAYKTFLNPDEYTAELAFMMISNHPNIIKPICIHKDSKSNQAGLLLEFIDGSPSSTFAKTASHHEIVEMAAQLLSVLAYVHKLEFLHADIKPQNIMVVNGQIKVLDFGLATQILFPKKRRGTPTTMAPELVYTGDVDSGVDWWAFGSAIAIWHGENLGFDKSKKVKRFVPLQYIKDSDEYKFGVVPKKFNEDLRQLIYVCLNPDPKKRKFSSFEQLKFLKDLRYFRNVNWDSIY